MDKDQDLAEERDGGLSVYLQRENKSVISESSRGSRSILLID